MLKLGTVIDAVNHVGAASGRLGFAYGVTMLGLLALAQSGCTPAELAAESYDLVLQGGRVMDPESGLDATRNVGIRGGRIEAISEDELTGDRTIDASGLVVAPGFIDLHVHGQSDEAFRLMARDGVTTALELEVGTEDVAAWYGEREAGQILNYGVSVGHIRVRMAVMGDGGNFLPSGPGGNEPASAEQIAEMAGRIRQGLADGAAAVGFGMAYTPAASTDEFEAMLSVAAEHGASSHIHVGAGLNGLRAAIDGASRTGSALHVVHANSSGGANIAEFLAIIEAARTAGQDVTTEMYPYEAGMTEIETALYDDWESWDDDRFAIHQWVETGERLTRESFGRFRAQGGEVIAHSRTPEMTRIAVESPLTMIASDGYIVDGMGHPRTSGTYSRVLGKHVREEGTLTLMEALRKMTIEPARRLETYVPAMGDKGQLRPGADADITVFDPATVIDRSTYTQAAIPSEGVCYTLVNGVLVVDGGELVLDARPGRPVRRN